MKFILSNNINSIGFAMDVSKEEMKKLTDPKYLANKMIQAHEAAQMIFEKFPEYKQVTLDTVSDEEREMIKQSKKQKSVN